MLALKTLAATAEPTTFLFDEVDAGIGGTTATAVGKRLRSLGKTHQVLCITHLPQIAALAEHHLAVEKRREKGRVVSRARVVEGAERVRELARMLGSVGEETERYARGLLRALEEG
jgi:DNA repair protein RecN (Recombination protein N)